MAEPETTTEPESTRQPDTQPIGWGLSFQTEGQTPIGNETKEKLKENEAYFVGDESGKTIYLSFDAGYENGNTEQILEALKKHNVTATFFVVGYFIENNQDLVKRISEEGHNVASHSYSHPDMSLMSREDFSNEMTKLEENYKNITGKDLIKLYRPPQGKYSEQSLVYAREMGYKTILWSLAYVDWEDKQPTREEAFKKLLGRIHPGAIVLLHSTSKTNAQILDELLSKWEEMGYTFGDLKDIS
ncbi:MAG: polysaccharide deacetylase family protein [Lachnospiraceae bacterium]|nr:polysaccharide deacetylase family protein [Lachnospiraceae bacterium]